MRVNIGPYPKKSSDTRKISVTIDGYDCWNADHTLALIIHPLLEKLSTSKQGSPNVDNEDVPEQLWISDQKLPYDEFDINFHKRWHWILHEMVWCFECLAFCKDESSFFDNGNFDEEGYAAHTVRIDNGLRLFGKYYRALWT